MANEDVYLKGKIKWAQNLRIPDLKFDPASWRCVHYPDDASLEIIKNLKKEGLKNWEKQDEDGTYFQWKRNVTYKNRKTGQDIPLTPPVVLDKDNIPYEGVIGNGSHATIKLEVYSHSTPNGGKAKAARLAAVRIDDLIPFERERDFKDDQKKVVAGLPEQPKPRPF